MKNMKKTLTMLLALALVLSLAAVPAWAAEDEPIAPEFTMWTPTSIVVRETEGQEYTIAPKGSEPDWGTVAEPEEGFVSFDDLTPATAYVVYTRVKGGEKSKTAELTIPLVGVGVFADVSALDIGVVLTAEPDPVDAEGLTYQWYHDTITSDGDAEHHELTAIEGAVEATYTIREEDMGKVLVVKLFKDGEEVGDCTAPGVVGEKPAPDEGEGCTGDASCTNSGFSDADPGAWYHDGVHWALEKGLMNGMGDGLFAPAGTATRAMVVTMLWRLEGEPAEEADVSFEDVSAEAWYADAVKWAAGAGVVTGTSDTAFSPDDPATREQLVTILFRYAKWKDAVLSIDTNILDYDDVFDVSSWAVEPFRWAVQEGIVNGVEPTKLGPGESATRAQIATMFQRLATALGNTASHVFTYDGLQVRVIVDVSGGWEAEFGEMATYLYDGPDDGEREAAAFGVYETKEEYDTLLAEKDSYEDFAEEDGRLTFTDSAGVKNLVIPFSDYLTGAEDMYYRIMVEPGNEAQPIFDRFRFELIGKADDMVDYGSSMLYSRPEMEAAVELILEEFGQWEGCEMHSIRYAGDSCRSEENLQWLNSLKDGGNYVDCIEFLSDFHSPVEGGGAWNPDFEYTDYQWWLARPEGGAWELLTWGY